jgi:hypothetical protein
MATMPWPTGSTPKRYPCQNETSREQRGRGLTGSPPFGLYTTHLPAFPMHPLRVELRPGRLFLGRVPDRDHI